MMVIGIDAHKRSHTAVADRRHRSPAATKTVGTTTQDHLRLLQWAVAPTEHACGRSRTVDT